MGVAPTVAAPGKKNKLGFSIGSGNLQLGYQVSQRLGLNPGDHLKLGDREFSVEKCLFEYGTEEDIYVYGSLIDVQTILGLDGEINEIKAIDCLCLTSDEEPVKILRAELEKVLPEAKVIQDRVQADARARQRQMIEDKFNFLSPLLIVIGAAWVGILAAINVRERRQEIGTLRALGHGSGTIASIFLGKAIMIGLVGAVVGFAVGTALALHYGPEIFKITAKALQTKWSLGLWALMATPLFAACSSFIPAMLAVTQDPAETLRDE